MPCIQDILSLTDDCNTRRSISLGLASEQSTQKGPTAEVYETHWLSLPSYTSSSSTTDFDSDEEESIIDPAILRLFPFPSTTTFSNTSPTSPISYSSSSSPCEESPVFISGYDGRPSTPLAPYDNDIPEKPVGQCPLSLRLDALPTIPCLAQQDKSRPLTFLISVLGLIARAQSESAPGLSRNGKSTRDEADDDEIRNRRVRAETQARAANIARATTRVWSRQELGVDPLETRIPLQHVRDFDDPAKENIFLFGWGQKGEERWKEDDKPRFTDPWNDDKVIPVEPLVEGDRVEDTHGNSGWRIGSSLSLGSSSSYGYRLSTPLDSPRSFHSFGSPHSPKARRAHNHRVRDFSADSIDTQMSGLGMEARYSS